MVKFAKDMQRLLPHVCMYKVGLKHYFRYLSLCIHMGCVMSPIHYVVDLVVYYTYGVQAVHQPLSLSEYHKAAVFMQVLSYQGGHQGGT